jgi:TPP-dependent pyruvate/acetoin dehydrogenase alpha subunit
VLTEAACEELEAEAAAQVARALEHARQAPLPNPSEAWEDVYA